MATSVSFYVPFSPSQSRALIVVPIFALLSAFALSFILYRSIRLVVIPSFRSNATSRAPENLLFRTHLGHYAASLVFSNAVLTSAGLMEFYWVKHSGIYQGSLCNVQAVLMQTGSWATCFFSVAMGIHTCSSLVFRLRQINWVSVVVIAFGWIASLAIGLGPLTKNDVYGPVIVSCGVTLIHPDIIFGLKSFPVLFGSVLAVIIYAVIFFVFRGILRVRGGIKFTFKPQEKWSASNNPEECDRFMGAIANSMLWYPVAFVMLLLPFTIANLTEFRGRNITFGFDVFVHACWSILGLVNVALLYNTFRVLSPVFHGRTLPKIQVDMEKSFGNSALDKSPILPPVIHNAKGPMLPLYTGRKNNDYKSGSVSPLSQSDAKWHSGNSFLSSADSTTHLLNVKRKPSRFHSMRVRQGTMPSRSRTILPVAELNLQLDLHMTEVNTAKPMIHTGSLSPPLRSAAASVIHPFSVSPALPANTSPMRQFTTAFGRLKPNARFGPRSKDGATLPTAFPVMAPLSPIRSVENPTTSEMGASRFRRSSASSNEARRPPQLDLIVTPQAPTVPVRPLPAIAAEVERSLRRPVAIPVQDEPNSRSVLRQLPRFPRNNTASSSSNNYDEGARGKALPEIPQTHDDISEKDSEHSFSHSIDTHERDMQSRRVTRSSIWSQESPTNTSYGHAPDMEAILAQLLGRG